jgi:hypothetical protein
MKKLVIGCLALLLSACGAGLLTPTRDFTTSDSVVLARAPTDFVQGASEVGRSLDYNISGVDNSVPSVSLSRGSGTAALMTVGRLRAIRITVALQPDRRTILLTLFQQGNMGTAGQSDATRRLERLKAALATRFR